MQNAKNEELQAVLDHLEATVLHAERLREENTALQRQLGATD